MLTICAKCDLFKPTKYRAGVSLRGLFNLNDVGEGYFLHLQAIILDVR